MKSRERGRYSAKEEREESEKILVFISLHIYSSQTLRLPFFALQTKRLEENREREKERKGRGQGREGYSKVLVKHQGKNLIQTSLLGYPCS